MPTEWTAAPIRAQLDADFTGEWGSSPERTAPNARVLRSTNLDDCGHVDLGGGSLRVVSEDKLLAKRLRDGDILLEASGGGPGKPVGRVALFKTDGGDAYLCSNFFRTLRPSSETNAAFLAWRLLHLYRQPVIWTFQQQTTGIINLKHRDYLAHVLRFPPLPEQHRIAEILDTLDETVRGTERVIAKLQQMKQGLLHDLLTRGIDENGELRDPERHPEQFKDSPLGPIPKAWEIAAFEQFAWPGRPFLKTGPFGSSLKGEHWVDEGVPVITIGALGEGEFIESELLFVSERKAHELAAYAVQPGDIVFSRVADVGRSVPVTQRQQGWIMSSNLMWISLDPERVVPSFVWLNLSAHSAVRAQVRRLVNAGGREIANAAILRRVLLAWPNLDEQHRIAACSDALHASTVRERTEVAKLRLLKQGLMDDLLTGRVRVPIPEEAAP